jgi:hypothetical protein
MEENQVTNSKPDINRDMGITLKQFFTIVFRWKIVVILCAILFLVMGATIGIIVDNKQSRVATIVEFQWDGISKGEYPNGDRFDYGSSFNSTIYGSVIENLDLNMAINDLQKVTTITPIVPSNILELSEKALLQNIDFSYYPTSFKISIYNGKANISDDQASRILTELIDEFRLEFERKYINKSIIIDFSQEVLTDYDYIEAVDILYSQVDIINNTISYVMPEANEYVSQELGIGFNEIIVRTDLLEAIELRNLESRINNYLLSKDKDLLITIYTYKVEQLELELAKEQSIATDLQLLIDNYQGGTSTIIIPGMTADQQIATEPYLNQLYEKLVTSQANVANHEQDIDYYETRIDRLLGNDPNFIISTEKQNEEILKVESGIQAAGQVLSEIVNDTEIMLTEYNRFVARGLIKTLTPPQSDSDNNFIIFAGAGFVIGSISGIGLAFLFDFRKKNTKKYLQSS